MPDDQRKPGKPSRLSKEFKEFSFDAPTPTPAPPPLPPVTEKPVILTKEDMDFIPFRGGGHNIPIRDLDEEERIEREEERAWEQREYEQAQERTFEAAGSIFRHNRPVTTVLTLISNLEMQSVLTAGILSDQYEGTLPKTRVNNMMIVALTLNAGNFNEICGELSPECVGMVDDLRMMSEEPDRELRLMQARNLEPDSKRVLLAMTISDLQMSLHEMSEMGEGGPTVREMADIADIIQAIAPGTDKGLRASAIDIFNRVSAATNNGATLKETPEGPLILNSMPDIEIPAPKSQAKKPASQQRKPRK